MPTVAKRGTAPGDIDGLAMRAVRVAANATCVMSPAVAGAAITPREMTAMTAGMVPTAIVRAAARLSRTSREQRGDDKDAFHCSTSPCGSACPLATR